MKKLTACFLLICILFTFVACSTNRTEKNDIVTLFQENEEIFLQAANSGDYSGVECIRGVQNVYISEKYIDIQCGGAGVGAETRYYGIYYSADDDLCAIDVAGPKDELVKSGEGYLYQEKTGDNRYYVEPLGNHFFYYEAEY